MKRKCPTMRGFNKRGIYRMKQFYETYKDFPFVSPLVTQISWTNNLLILSGTNSMEEKEFYIKMCIKNDFSYYLYNYFIDFFSIMNYTLPPIGLVLILN